MMLFMFIVQKFQIFKFFVAIFPNFLFYQERLRSGSEMPCPSI
jgi:hypothetical protein